MSRRMVVDVNEDDIQHYGVKGMKWGIRRYQPYQPGDKVEGGKFVGKAKSLEREAKMAIAAKNYKKMSDSEIKTLTNRLRNENQLKSLSKKSGDKSDSDAYTKRAEMSDEVLESKVQRLHLENNLRSEAGKTTKQQKEIALKVVAEAANIGLDAYTAGVSDAAINSIVRVADKIEKEQRKELPKLDIEKDSMQKAISKYVNKKK